MLVKTLGTEKLSSFKYDLQIGHTRIDRCFEFACSWTTVHTATLFCKSEVNSNRIFSLKMVNDSFQSLWGNRLVEMKKYLTLEFS